MREKIANVIVKYNRRFKYENGVLVDLDKPEDLADQIIALTVGELKKQIEAKRANAFSVSLFGDREHQIKMDAMVNAYDVILGLIKEMLE